MFKANRLLIRNTCVLFIFIFLVCCTVFYLPYRVLKRNTVDSLNQQQLVLAHQASQGIREFFFHYENLLTYYAEHPDIIELNESGKKMLAELYSINKKQIRAVTRISAEGQIIYTVPYRQGVIGMDVSSQAHNAAIMQHHKPVVSDVFLAVQGYRTVAFAIPVFTSGRYAGSLTILIPFDVISKKYLQGIQLGDDGYAWMLNKKGTELYCPVPGHIGKSVRETSSEFPDVLRMASEMMGGKEGVTIYRYDRIRDQKVQTIVKHAAYVPVELPNTTWSIVVASPDRYVFSAISGFVKWWLVLFLLVMVGLVAYVFFYVRAQLVTTAEKRRREAVEKLVESERFFKQVINDSHIPLHVVNADGVVELVNRKSEEIYGYSIEDIPTADHWFRKAYPDESLRHTLEKTWHTEVRQAIEARDISAIQPIELPVRCKDGTVKDVLFDYTLTEDMVTISLTDKTAYNAMERERQRMMRREEKAKKMEMIGLLAGGVAHDLNNILSGIVSYPDMLISTLPAENALIPPLVRIRESGLRAVAVVDDLLTAARGMATTKENCEIDQLVLEYLASPEHERIVVSNPEVEFSSDLSASGHQISCSPVHMKKVLMNLVANGAEAIEERGKVHITTAVIDTGAEAQARPEYSELSDFSPGKYVKIRVTDSGPGIPEQYIQRIFEPFYTRKKLGRSGSGLGLMIVQNSVEDHGGRVVARSSKFGTTFKIYLPIAETEEHVVSNEVDPGSSPVGAGERILVVDDEPLLREVAVQTLSRAGYIVTAVRSGEEALDYLHHSQVDLVLLDMVMDPGMNGRETFEKIRKFIPDQKAIIVSGFSENEDVKIAIDLGSGALLKKPYTRQALLRAVRGELERE